MYLAERNQKPLSQGQAIVNNSARNELKLFYQNLRKLVVFDSICALRTLEGYHRNFLAIHSHEGGFPDAPLHLTWALHKEMLDLDWLLSWQLQTLGVSILTGSELDMENKEDQARVDNVLNDSSVIGPNLDFRKWALWLADQTIMKKVKDRLNVLADIQKALNKNITGTIRIRSFSLLRGLNVHVFARPAKTTVSRTLYGMARVLAFSNIISLVGSIVIDQLFSAAFDEFKATIRKNNVTDALDINNSINKAIRKFQANTVENIAYIEEVHLEFILSLEATSIYKKKVLDETSLVNANFKTFFRQISDDFYHTVPGEAQFHTLSRFKTSKDLGTLRTSEAIDNEVDDASEEHWKHYAKSWLNANTNSDLPGGLFDPGAGRQGRGGPKKDYFNAAAMSIIGSDWQKDRGSGKPILLSPIFAVDQLVDGELYYLGVWEPVLDDRIELNRTLTDRIEKLKQELDLGFFSLKWEYELTISPNWSFGADKITYPEITKRYFDIVNNFPYTNGKFSSFKDGGPWVKRVDIPEIVVNVQFRYSHLTGVSYLTTLQATTIKIIMSNGEIHEATNSV